MFTLRVAVLADSGLSALWGVKAYKIHNTELAL